MTARTRGALAAACLIALTFAASAPGTADAGTTAASAASTSTATVGWVRLAQLSPTTAPIDWYVYSAGSTNAQVVIKDVSYGALSPYESLAPGGYLVAIRAAGNAPTGNALISTQITVAAGQAYTVAGLGAAAVPTLRVLDDKLDAAQGKASVRVIEASQRTPTVSVAAGGATIATDLQFPDVTDYQTVAPGSSAVRVSTQTTNAGAAATATATARLNFAADSTYTVVVLDGSGSGSAPQIFDLSDGSGVTVAPKGGVNTGFGGMAAQLAGSRIVAGSGSGSGSGTGSKGNVFPGLQVVLLIVAVGAVAFGFSRRRK